MRDQLQMSLNERIKSARLARGLRQVDLAFDVAVVKDMISAYERGTRRPSPETARRLEAVLGIDLGIPDKRCCIDGCADRYHARDLCKRHYGLAQSRGLVGRRAP